MKNERLLKLAATAAAMRLPYATRDEVMLQSGRKLFELGHTKVNTRWQEFRKKDPGFTLTMSSNVKMFSELERWINDNVVGEVPKTFSAITLMERNEQQRIVGYRFETVFATKEMKIRWQGCEFEVKYEVFSSSKAFMEAMKRSNSNGEAEAVPDPGGGSDFAIEYAEARNDGSLNVSIIAKDRPDFDRLRAKMEELTQEAFVRERGVEAGKIDYYYPERWGEHWTHVRLPGRPLESVAMKAGQAEAITKDLEDFYADEASYNKLSFPYRRGYLVHGPPGTGKTSMVKALATHFDLALYSINLAAVEGDARLMALVSRMAPRSALLIEDIDTFDVAKDRDAEGKKDNTKLTLSGLLNAIDGIATPHGLMIFALTNHPEHLDPALTRSGRLDNHLLLDHADTHQLNGLFQIAYGENPGLEVPDGVTITTSDIAELFKGNFDNLQQAINQYKLLIGEKQ